MHIGMLAGEASGDILGAAVARELNTRYSNLQLSGIGGPLLEAQGLESLHPMDRLSVMGFVEPLKRLPELLSIRQAVYEQQLSHRPDVFLGVDSPDFNLTLERKLRAKGVTTAHLVSPSVWAWRSGRVKSIARAVDLMLCLLPFELDVYQRAGIPAVCVGHPLIEELALVPDRVAARTTLGLDANRKIIAVLPGSRGGEVASLLPIFVPTMQRLAKLDGSLQFVMPAANAARRQQIETALAGSGLPVMITDGEGRLAMSAADAVLLASGTATLEAMLLRRPMVIAYHMGWFSWQLLSRLATTRFVGLPNVLADREVVPELLQDACQPSALTDAMVSLFEGGDAIQLDTFEALRQHIGGDFSVRCADAIDGLTRTGSR